MAYTPLSPTLVLVLSTSLNFSDAHALPLSLIHGLSMLIVVLLSFFVTLDSL
jgi:hypothetical protein